MKSLFFLSCDWGTTHFRLRLVDRKSGTVVDALKSAYGVARMAEECSAEVRGEKYARRLSAEAEILIARSGAEVSECVVSGMASSNLGWRELPYASLPLPLDGSGITWELLSVPMAGRGPLNVRLISGVCGEENVMRGEETELLGLVQQLPFLAYEDVLLVMPGTHSKHIQLSGGKMVSFDTVMTGELFAHLPNVPTLRGALSSSSEFDFSNPWFAKGARDTAESGFLKSLFKIRARSLLAGTQATDAMAYLSGLLIGAELAQIPKRAGLRVVIASGGSLGALYRRAADELGLEAAEFVGSEVMDRAAVQGHCRILDHFDQAVF